MPKRKMDADLPLHPSIGTHEVFISHRGIDMKRKFANHLYHSLKQRGIKAFLDMEELPLGHDVRPFMLEAARRAIIQVPIFTTIYAESRWCLDELVQMMKSTRSASNAKVIPVFYDVSSEELRNTDGPFAKAIKAHREEGKVDKDTIKGWEDALLNASWLEGFRLETYNHFEGKLVNDLVAKIVEEMQVRIPVEEDRDAVGLEESVHDGTLVVEDRGAVGLEDRVHDVVKLFHLEEKRKVYFVLVWGMGGIGKTTLARAVYKRLGKGFQAASLVENCGDEKPCRIQDRLLEDLLREKGFPGNDVGNRRARLKHGLREKQVLIVLDDVKTGFDSIEEVVDLTSLHPGSRILVTSRDQRVFPHVNTFSDVFRGEHYELQCMHADKSLRLFCLHAFRKNCPDQGFERLAMTVSQACGGLPLSLEVLGRHLSMRKEKDIWEEAITLLRSDEYQDISSRLLISYKALTENQQEMFLDVACLLIGEHEHSAKYFWDGLVKGWRTGLKRLVELCLVKLGEDDRLTMHDHLRDLGRCIVQKESQNSGKWSRLWDDEDLLQSKQGLHQIRGLVTSLPNLNAGLLSQMQSLRLLFFFGTSQDGVGDSAVLEGLQIRWLKWRTHFTKVPSFFRQLKKLRKLDMRQCTKLEELPEGFGGLESLEELDVYNSAITKLPSSFGQLKKLRKLDMGECRKLEELPEGFGGLESLEELDVRGSAITKLPSSFGQLKNLRKLDIGGCKKLEELEELLEELPECLRGLEHLEELDAYVSAITKFPSSFGQLKNLRKLSMGEFCKLPSFGQLKNLREFDMSGCCKLEELPESFGGLEGLEELDVRGSAITKLPSSFGQLKKLRKLDMNQCMNLEELPEGFGGLESLEELDANGLAITKLPSSFVQLKKVRKLDMGNCRKLEELPEGFGGLESLEELDAHGLAITKLPSSFGQLKKVRKLDMGNCRKLEELPEGFGGLESLEELDANGLAITKLPSSFGQLKKVRKLDMRYCVNLEELPEGFGGLESLEELDVSFVAITKLPSSFGQLKKVRKLDMGNCRKLEELPEGFGGLESLEELDAHGLAITKLPSSFGQLKKVRKLDMGNCRKLEELPEGFGGLESLEELDVSFVAITKLPSSFGQLKKVRKLNMRYCMKLEELPEGIEGFENLEELDVQWSAITKLPSSFWLKKLRSFNPNWCIDELELAVLQHLLEDLQRMEDLQRDGGGSTTDAGGATKIRSS